MKGSIICILIPNYSLGKQWGYILFCLKDLEELNWTMFFLIRKTLFFQKKQNMYRCLMAQQNFGFFLQSLFY